MRHIAERLKCAHWTWEPGDDDCRVTVDVCIVFAVYENVSELGRNTIMDGVRLVTLDAITFHRREGERLRLPVYVLPAWMKDAAIAAYRAAASEEDMEEVCRRSLCNGG